MRIISLACLGSLLLLVSLGPVAGREGVSKDEKLLQDHKIATDGPALLDFLKKRFTSSVKPEKIAHLIEQLGDDSFLKREEASQLLVQMGTRARKHLLDALKHGDLEIRTRAQACLREIERDGVSTQLLTAAVHVIAKRKPTGAVPVLLDPLPMLMEDPVLKVVGLEIQEALVELAVREEKADPALVAALEDKASARRCAAGCALARAKAPGQMSALLKLLEDPELDVRVALAMTLIRKNQPEAVPVLIATLDQPNFTRFGEVEEILFQLATDKSPTLASQSASARTKYREDWQAWWKDNKDTVKLDVLEAREKHLGRTVVVLLDENKVLDLDTDNKIRWEINIEKALDVQPLPGDKVLIAEHDGKRVSERDRKGKVVWEYKIEKPLTAQRLTNGHTLIANTERVIEVDRGGKLVFNYTPPAGADIMRVRKLPGGDILLITQLGGPTHFIRIDRFGKAIKSFGVQVYTSGGRIDVTPTGNYLVPELQNNRIAEYDPEGKLLRNIPATQPIACVSLPNGNVIYTSMTQNRAVEIDPAGKEVWQYRRDTRVTRAVRY
jgi:hypothetical protein